MATADVTYQCFASSDHGPVPGEKTTVTRNALTGSATFPVVDGKSSGFAWVAPPDPGTFTCPADQKLRRVSETYAGIKLTGSDPATAVDVKPDPASRKPAPMPLKNKP